MFGCGKFDDLTMLQFIDETLDEGRVHEVEAHLRDCDSCLAELTELTRLNAVMDAGTPEKIRVHTRLQVFLRDSGIFNFDSSSPAEMVDPAAVRSLADSGSDFLRMELPEPPVVLSIIPVEKDVWIGLEWRDLSGKYVELMERETSAPVFMRKADSDSLTIKGVQAGSYLLHIDETVVDIEIKEDS